ncbi:MAG: ABC transporter substrate-binding protein [Alphaproteobacteria bacterium]|nr:ABC transporter substrate-binding protein [Alphaproteobacteria bacterium]
MKTIDQLSRLYASGKVSRRTFMQGATALGLTIAAASSLAVRAEAATPKQGGMFRVGQGHGSTTDSLDPSTFENGFSTFLGFAIANHLTEVGPDGQLRPELAESYEASADAATWRFKLRKGVTFHNGKSLTTEDVIDSFNHHRGEASKSAAKGLLTAVTDISVDGDTIVFKLTDGNADFPFIVSDYHFAIRPSNGDGTIDWASGIGTGGYVLNKFDPGVRGEYTRYGDYWKPNAAYFDEILQLSIIDVTARQNALMNGDVDTIDRVDPKTVHLLKKVPTVNIVETTGTLHYTFPMRLDTPPFGNKHLRTALKLSVKRQEMVDKILLGHGVMGNDFPISTANQYHNGDLPQREFDADKAAFHYKLSGHSGTIKLSSSDAAFAGAVDAAQLIKASAGEVGIDIEVVREPSDGYWSNVWNKKGWSAAYWGGRPTEDWMFSAAYTNNTEWNDTAWKGTTESEKFNQIVVAARKELDTTKRRAMYYEAQALIRDDGGAIIPMFANLIMGVSKSIGHSDVMAGNWELDGSKAAERWWRES